MRNTELKKPWYFLTLLIPYILSPIVEKFVNPYIKDEWINGLLTKSITVKVLLPISFCVLIFIVCSFVYISQIKEVIGRCVTTDELEDINKKLDKYVDEYEYIESVQAYQYWCKHDNDSTYIKVGYLAGVADERIDINSIMQTYYYIPYSINKKIKQISDLYNRLSQEEDVNVKQNLKIEFMKNGEELSETILKTLNSLTSVDEIKKYHCELYRILLRILSAISGEAIEAVLQNKEIEKELITNKKTGILGSIVLEDLYIFKNMSSTSKGDRIYFTFPYDVKRGIVFLASMSSKCFSQIDDKNVADYCENVVKRICSQS